MRLIKLCLISLLMALPAMSATAAPATPKAKPKPYVTIPFVNHGAIQDWRPVDDKAILIATTNNRWYKATFFAPCFNLDGAFAVGFVTHPIGTLDKFSSILVDGQQCWFRDLQEVPAPAKTAKTS